MSCIPWGHEWTKWEQYLWQGKVRSMFRGELKADIAISELRQKRTCKVCGKMQDGLVRDG